MNAAIIIFVRHPEPGKVKTRLAATIGDENAVKVYHLLLKHTFDLIKNSSLPVYVYYADMVMQDDLWRGNNIIKRCQATGDLGEKMAHAFQDVFADGYSKVVIIGSDCYELNRQMVYDCLEILETKEIVIGPAKDGGYYLLGMRSPFKNLFQGIAWSTGAVFKETVRQVQRNNYSVHILPVLTDVDTEEDISFSY